MQISNTYMRYDCVRFMDENDKKRFEKIIGQYAEELNKIDSSNGTVFTLHDFDHHCRNLYRIISENLLAETAYGEGGLSSRELYILNLAVLLHDIGLKKYVIIKRGCHATESAEIIGERYHCPTDMLSEASSGLSLNDIYALQAIVAAHSDEKKGKETKCALDNEELRNDMPCSFGRVRAHFLANILRLADELDITTERLGSADVVKELEKAKEQLFIEKSNNGENIKYYENAVESLEYWERLNLFSELKIDEGGIVHAVMDNRYVKQIIDGGGSLEKILSETVEVKRKIESEFALFNRDVSKIVMNSNLVKMKGFVIDAENQDIKNEIESEDYAKFGNHDVKVNIISEEFERKISDFIDKKQLWDGGHYYRRDDLCARDWINIREITGTNWFFKKCESLMISTIANVIDVNHINRKDVAIIGVDFSGMLIGSKVALTLGMPFIYAINGDKNVLDSPRKLTVDLEENIIHVIVMTDVIVTYHTITELLRTYNLSDKLLAIFGVLYRKPIVSGKHEKALIDGDFTELEKKTYVFNKDYGIELHCSKDCPIKGTYKCIAENLPAGV